jgi:hypothetical protein
VTFTIQVPSAMAAEPRFSPALRRKTVGAKHLRRRAGKYTLEFYHFTIYVAFAAVLARAFFPMRDL